MTREQVISYQRPTRGTEFYNPAGFMIIVWSCVMFLLGLLLALLTCGGLSIAPLGHAEVLGFAPLAALGSYGCIRRGIALIDVSRWFFENEAVNVKHMIKWTRLDVIVYCAGGGLVVAGMEAGVWAAIAGGILLAMGGGLTYSRALLRRVDRFQRGRAGN